MESYWAKVVLGILAGGVAMAVISVEPALAIPILVVALIVFIVQVRRAKR